MEDNFNDDIFDVSKFSKINNPNTQEPAVVEEKNSRIEVFIPVGIYPNTPFGIRTRSVRDVRDFEAVVDIVMTPVTNHVCFVIGRLHPRADMSSLWDYPHYRITYTPIYDGWVRCAKRETEAPEDVTVAESFQGTPTSSHVRLRIRIQDNHIDFWWNEIYIGGEDCSWFLNHPRILNMAAVEASTSTTLNIETTVLIDNYIEFPASTPPETHTISVTTPEYGSITPNPEFIWSYPHNWELSFLAEFPPGMVLEKWVANGVDLPPDNPLILKISENALVEAIFAGLPLGTVNGTVLDGETSYVIPNALITCDTKSTQTDTTGFYKITDLEPGDYTITCRKAGYEAQSRLVTIVAGEVITENFEMYPTAAPPTPCPFHAAYLPYHNHPDLVTIRRFRNACVPPRLRELYYKVTPMFTRFVVGHCTRSYIIRRVARLLIKLRRR